MLGALGEFDLLLGESVEVAALFSVVVQPTLVTRALEAQRGDLEVESLREKISSGKVEKGFDSVSRPECEIPRPFVCDGGLPRGSTLRVPSFAPCGASGRH